MSDKLRQRVPLNTCAKCRKAFAAGDRVIPTYIVQKVANNPMAGQMGAWIGDDFEFVHASCPDPQLEARIVHFGAD